MFRVGFRHERVSADHMTIQFKPRPEHLSALPIGEEIEIEVDRVFTSQDCQVRTRECRVLPFAASSYVQLTWGSLLQALGINADSLPSYMAVASPHVTVSVSKSTSFKSAGDSTPSFLDSARSLGLA